MMKPIPNWFRNYLISLTPAQIKELRAWMESGIHEEIENCLFSYMY